jgi:hypothetical protein
MAQKKRSVSKKRPINVTLQKGALEGYHTFDSTSKRRKHLLDLIKKNHATYSEVIKRLNVLAIYNKNRAPEVSSILRRDIAYLQRQLSPFKPKSISPVRSRKRGSKKKKLKSVKRKTQKKLSCEQKKISQVMGEFKRKSLKTPNKKVVKNRKQAIAIALNVARKSCEKKKK